MVGSPIRELGSTIPRPEKVVIFLSKLHINLHSDVVFEVHNATFSTTSTAE